MSDSFGCHIAGLLDDGVNDNTRAFELKPACPAGGEQEGHDREEGGVDGQVERAARSGCNGHESGMRMKDEWRFETPWILANDKGHRVGFARAPDCWLLRWWDGGQELNFEIMRVMPLPGHPIPFAINQKELGWQYLGALQRSLGPICYCYPSTRNPPLNDELAIAVARDLKGAVVAFSRHYTEKWPGWMTVVAEIIFKGAFSRFSAKGTLEHD